jgi:hypothetical protein
MKSFGIAIEELKQHESLIMYREAWHGIELGKKMGITLETLEGVLLFVFNVNENRYAWTPSQHDMLSDDWVVNPT